MSDVKAETVTQVDHEPNANSGATHVEMGDEKLLSFVGPSNKESTFAKNSHEMIFGVLSTPKD